MTKKQELLEHIEKNFADDCGKLLNMRGNSVFVFDCRLKQDLINVINRDFTDELSYSLPHASGFIESWILE